jgi:hypothetical protein
MFRPICRSFRALRRTSTRCKFNVFVNCLEANALFLKRRALRRPTIARGCSSIIRKCCARVPRVRSSNPKCFAEALKMSRDSPRRAHKVRKQRQNRKDARSVAKWYENCGSSIAVRALRLAGCHCSFTSLYSGCVRLFILDPVGDPILRPTPFAITATQCRPWLSIALAHTCTKNKNKN